MAELQQARRALLRPAREVARPAMPRGESKREGRSTSGGMRSAEHLLASHCVQARLSVNARDDSYEREADRAATEVMRMPDAGAFPVAMSLTRLAQRKPLDAKDDAREDERRNREQGRRAQKKEGLDGTPAPGPVPKGIESAVSGMMQAGEPLSGATRAFFEPRFGADLGGVRVHTDGAAAVASRALQAQAFTVGSHIFFAAGRFQPETPAGRFLLAHELAHTIQQTGATAPRAAQIEYAGSRSSSLENTRATSVPAPARAMAQTETRVQRTEDEGGGGLHAREARWFRDVPGYVLLTFILGFDPIADVRVERTPKSLVEAILALVPFGSRLFAHLEEAGSVDRFLAWVQEQLAGLDVTWEGVKALVARVWDDLGLRDLFDREGAREKIGRIVAPTLGRLVDFARRTGEKVIELVREQVLGRLSLWAREQRGYKLLTFVVGKDPITNAPVVRTAVTFVQAVLELVPGGDEIFRNLQRSRTIERTVEWLHQQIETLGLTWDAIKALFRRAWDAVSVPELLDPPGIIEKMREIFAPPANRVVDFAAAAGKKVLEFIFEGAMMLAGPLGMQIVGLVRRVGDTFLLVVGNPVRFVGNLVTAVKRGFSQFVANILDHLRTGLLGWLFGALEGAGLQLPERWDLRGILSLVLQVLGITYVKMRAKLVRVIGEARVATLERTFEFVRLIVAGGLSAVWEKIVEGIGSLTDLVIGGIRNWVVTRIVTAAVTKLVTMLNPAGAIIQAIIAAYNAIAFFVERIRQIGALVEAIVDSIGNIATGKLSAAANYIERTMARTIPIILGFLARFSGLGDVSGAIRGIIVGIRARVDLAIDRMIDWVVARARALLGRERPDERPAATQGDARWTAAIAGVQGEIERMQSGPGVSPSEVGALLPQWKQQFGFKRLAIEDGGGGAWRISGEVNPRGTIELAPRVKTSLTYTDVGGKAKTAFAMPLGVTDYAAPAADPIGWERLAADARRRFWVRGHLIHGRSGGPGTRWNLVPISKGVNADMWHGHEKKIYNDLKRPIEERRYLWKDADVTYSHRNIGVTRPSDFASKITIRYGEAKLKRGGEFTKANVIDTFGYPVPAPTPSEVTS